MRDARAGIPSRYLKEIQAMKVTDPVCGMSIESQKAHATETYQGRSYYLCSPQCQRSFKADPAKYAAKAAGEGGHPQHA